MYVVNGVEVPSFVTSTNTTNSTTINPYSSSSSFSGDITGQITIEILGKWLDILIHIYDFIGVRET